MANDYYDFNPTAGTWAILLTVMVLFVLAICVLLIAMVHRSEAVGVRTHAAPAADAETEEPPLKAAS